MAALYEILQFDEVQVRDVFRTVTVKDKEYCTLTLDCLEVMHLIRSGWATLGSTIHG